MAVDAGGDVLEVGDCFFRSDVDFAFAVLAAMCRAVAAVVRAVGVVSVFVAAAGVEEEAEAETTTAVAAAPGWGCVTRGRLPRAWP